MVLSKFVVFGIFVSASVANAQETFIFPSSQSIDLQAYIETAPAAPLPAPIDLIRVQVFPHLGKYPNPHGKETALSSISLISDKDCEVLKHVKGEQVTANVSAGHTMRFTLSGGELPAYLKCSGTTKVVRQSGMVNRSYFGDFIVSAASAENGTNFVRVVNQIGFEEYLRGVVPSEMPASWGPEALKAQAVAARTYAAYEILLARSLEANLPFDVDDTVNYQAYRGSEVSVSTDEAIKSTEGTIMVFNGEVVRAYFSADNGGVTEVASNVWPTRGDLSYTTTKVEPYDVKFLPAAWKLTYTMSTLTTKARNALWINDDELVTALVVPEGGTFESTRVAYVEFTVTDSKGENAHQVKVLGTDFEYAFSLKSTLFTLTTSGTRVTLDGRGYGHGVGMGQWGAKVLSEQMGMTFQEILMHYFDGIEFANL